jgi:hypothetical protein
MENFSDGYHTFGELYEFRKVYNACLFNEWALQNKYNVYKSQRHHNNSYCFNNPNYFIVCASLPDGQISNHYEMKDWDIFKIPIKDKAELFDGHTAQDVILRLKNI